jgi:nucleoside-diphosphate-sugar epimerase
MKNILVIGSTGQIGSELTMLLRRLYGDGHVVAGYITGSEPKGDLALSGPMALADVTDGEQIAGIVKRYHIETIYNLAALLSVVAESKPRLAWQVGIDGLWNVLEVAREHNCAVFTPSSIGSFGLNTPHDMTPQDTIQRPRTIYGISKVTTELLSDWYYYKYGVDTRSVRFPGIISYMTPPGGGTTDYAVDIYYAAVRGEVFTCPIKAGTRMDMMYMPDALRAATELMEANPDTLIHRNGFNVAAMSFDPDMIYHAILKLKPGFRMVYEIDPLKQSIAESWPDMMDDTCARKEWKWQHRYDLPAMTKDMIEKLSISIPGAGDRRPQS